MAVTWSLALAAAVAAAGQLAESAAEYDSKGKAVAVECFEPFAAGRRPAIVILYGSGGLEPPPSGEGFRELARALAGRGYAVFLPHYFDRTGATMALRSGPNDFPAWQEAVADAIDYAAGRPGVDPERIGLLGMSLGASLSYLQAVKDSRIKALVTLGGRPPDLGDRLDKLPPVLMLNGGADRVLPAKDRPRVEALLKAHHVTYALHIYKGMGHNFDMPRLADAERRAASFFAAHLKPPRPPATPRRKAKGKAPAPATKAPKPVAEEEGLTPPGQAPESGAPRPAPPSPGGRGRERSAASRSPTLTAFGAVTRCAGRRRIRYPRSRAPRGDAYLRRSASPRPWGSRAVSLRQARGRGASEDPSPRGQAVILSTVS